MLMYPWDKVTFINEKVQWQVGGSDCGLFSLAFATDLCHGIDPTNQKYNQGSMRQHYVNCLANGAMSPSPKLKRECHVTWAVSSHLLLFTVCVDHHMTEKNMFSAAMENAKNGIIPPVLKYQPGQ